MTDGFELPPDPFDPEDWVGLTNIGVVSQKISYGGLSPVERLRQFVLELAESDPGYV